MKPLDPTDTNPFGLLDQFLEFGLNGANTARNILNPLVSQCGTCETTDQQLKIHEDEQSYHALLDLPGVKKKDVHIEIDDGKLVMSASRNDPFGTDDAQASRYKHTLRLGEQVDPKDISATLKDGTT